MNYTKAPSLFLYLLLLPILTVGQAETPADSIVVPKDYSKNLKFNAKQLIIPGVLMTYGVVSLDSPTLKEVNRDIRNSIMANEHAKTTVDNYTQYVPALAVYGLNVCGIKGKNNFEDRTIILGTSYLLMTSMVLPLKSLTHVERPDGSADNSFPSGHTATAFVGAEFMWQEYKDKSVWYGISGYAIAAGTGYLRMYNDKHWFSDVVMGAGIGILSTKAAYWLFPYIDKKLFPSEKKNTVMLLPFYNGKQTGIGMLWYLK